MRMRLALLLVAIAALTATVAANALEGRDRLLGTWEPVGGKCDGDNHVTFERDGTYRAYAESGTWRRRGRQLERFVSRRGEPGDEMRKVQPPEREEAAILSLSDRMMVVRTKLGSTRRLHRCR